MKKERTKDLYQSINSPGHVDPSTYFSNGTNLNRVQSTNPRTSQTYTPGGLGSRVFDGSEVVNSEMPSRSLPNRTLSHRTLEGRTFEGRTLESRTLESRTLESRTLGNSIDENYSTD